MLDVLVFIHGFGSSSKSTKSDYLRNVAAELDIDFIAVDYDSSASYDEIKRVLNEQIPERTTGLIVGSSLGGYWATEFANSRCWPVMLLNPSVQPDKTLDKYSNNSVNGVSIKKENVLSYQDNKFSSPRHGCIAMFETGDDILDYKIAYKMIGNKAKKIVIEGGSHRFENMHLVGQEIVKLNNK